MFSICLVVIFFYRFSSQANTKRNRKKTKTCLSEFEKSFYLHCRNAGHVHCWCRFLSELWRLVSRNKAPATMVFLLASPMLSYRIKWAADQPACSSIRNNLGQGYWFAILIHATNPPNAKSQKLKINIKTKNTSTQTHTHTKKYTIIMYTKVEKSINIVFAFAQYIIIFGLVFSFSQ